MTIASVDVGYTGNGALEYDPYRTTSRGPGANPSIDVRAPLDGCTFYLGIRAEL